MVHVVFKYGRFAYKVTALGVLKLSVVPQKAWNRARARAHTFARSLHVSLSSLSSLYLSSSLAFSAIFCCVVVLTAVFSLFVCLSLSCLSFALFLSLSPSLSLSLFLILSLSLSLSRFLLFFSVSPSSFFPPSRPSPSISLYLCLSPSLSLSLYIYINLSASLSFSLCPRCPRPSLLVSSLPFSSLHAHRYGTLDMHSSRWLHVCVYVFIYMYIYMYMHMYVYVYNTVVLHV